MMEFPYKQPSRQVVVLGGQIPRTYTQLKRAFAWDKIWMANNSGEGVYFLAGTMRQGKSKRLKENIGQVQAVWLDKDNGELDPETLGYLKPSVTVQTSPGKYQYYWVLDEPFDIAGEEDRERFEHILKGCIAHFDGDTARSNINSLMRMPGFVNQKNGFEVKATYDECIYTLAELETAWPCVMAEAVEESKEYDGEEKYDLSECISAICSGDRIHESRVKISMSLANLNVPEYICIQVIDGLVDAGHDFGNIEEERYKERRNNNRQVVRTAYNKVFSEIPEYAFAKGNESAFTKLPEFKPGPMKLIVEDIMRNMFHPVYEVAVPLAMHVVGTFGGANWQLDGVTVTRRRAICMQSGSGKDVVTDYINTCINNLKDTRAKGFVGTNAFTPRVVHKELGKFRCRSYVVSEAGLAGQSESGDIKNMRSFMLQALGGKAQRSLSIQATTADVKDADGDISRMHVHGAVLNIIAESTIETYANMLRMTQADVSGMMAREELIFPEPDFDFDKSHPAGFTEVSEEVFDIIRPMAQNFLDGPGQSGLQMVRFEQIPRDRGCDQRLRELHALHCEVREKMKLKPSVYQTQYSRWFEKVKCTALILGIAEGRLKVWHLDYAEKYQNALIGTIINHLSTGALSQPMDAVIARLEQKIEEFPSSSRDTQPKFCPNVHKRIVTKSWMSQVLKTSMAEFKVFTESVYRNRPMDARTAVIREALDRGLIEQTTLNDKTCYILARSK